MSNTTVKETLAHIRANPEHPMQKGIFAFFDLKNHYYALNVEDPKFVEKEEAMSQMLSDPAVHEMLRDETIDIKTATEACVKAIAAKKWTDEQTEMANSLIESGLAYVEMAQKSNKYNDKMPPEYKGTDKEEEYNDFVQNVKPKLLMDKKTLNMEIHSISTQVFKLGYMPAEERANILEIHRDLVDNGLYALKYDNMAFLLKNLKQKHIDGYMNQFNLEPGKRNPRFYAITGCISGPVLNELAIAEKALNDLALAKEAYELAITKATEPNLPNPAIDEPELHTKKKACQDNLEKNIETLKDSKILIKSYLSDLLTQFCGILADSDCKVQGSATKEKLIPIVQKTMDSLYENGAPLTKEELTTLDSSLEQTLSAKTPALMIKDVFYADYAKTHQPALHMSKRLSIIKPIMLKSLANEMGFEKNTAGEFVEIITDLEVNAEGAITPKGAPKTSKTNTSEKGAGVNK